MIEQQFTTEELNSEEWKAVPQWEGLYEVSNLGRVKSVRQNLYLSPNSNTRGYLAVTFQKTPRRYKIRVNRLVAMVFLGTPENCETYEADHKNGVITDNRASNLQWLTKDDHRKITVERGQHLRAEDHPNASLTNQEVAQIKWAMGEPYSIENILAMFNISLGVFEQIRCDSNYASIPWLRPRSKAIRKKAEGVSQKMLELWKDPEYRRRMSDAHKGKRVPQSQRDKISASVKRARAK